MSVTRIETDQASLVVFDPEQLQHRVRDSRDWWQLQPQHVVEEVAEGKIGIFAIGRHGTYRIALRVDQGLSEEEEAYAVGEADGYGLSVSSGKVFCGASERLPCEGRGKVIAQIPNTGAVFDVPPGDYEQTVYVLHWREDDRFYDEENEVVPDAPADFVVELRPVAARLEVRSSPPALLDLIPKKEAKGEARIRYQPKRRRGSAPSEPSRRSRSEGPPATPTHRGGSDPVAPRHVPEEVAPFREVDVQAAFREVLTGTTLHPVPGVGAILRLDLHPRDRKLQAPDVDMEGLFKKITRVREQARMLEAKVNTRLEPWESSALHPEITGIYASLDDLLDFLASEGPGSPA